MQTHLPPPPQHDSGSLTRLVEELQKSKADLEAKRHTETLLAKLISLMRWRNDDTLEIWADRLLDELVLAVEGLQASLYRIERAVSDGKNIEFLMLTGVYAFDKNKIRKEIPLGEGIIGQVAKSRRPAYFGAETQFEPFSASGITQVKPRALRVQPLIYNEVLAGVLEISSVKEIGVHETEFILQISENIAANLINISSQVETRRLYLEMQVKSEALVSQEEEMRQNVEELQATQEEMRRVQISLKEEADRTKVLLESMRDAVITIEKGRFLECNAAALRIFGCETRSEFLGKGWADFSAPQQNSGRPTDEEIPERLLRAMNENGTSFEWKAKRKSNEEFDTEIYLSPFDYQGATLLLMVVRDISEQKKNEARLMEQQQQMQIAQSIARMGSWQLDLRTKNTLWTDSMYQIYNVSPEAGPLDYEMLAQMTYFEDRDVFKQSYMDLVMYGSRSNIEYRIMPRGGDIKWVRTDGFAVRNDKGDIVKVYGLVQDITEQKERETEVTEKNQELAAREIDLQKALKRTTSLFNNSGDAILIIKDYILDDINPAGLRLFAVADRDQMMGARLDVWCPELQPDGSNSVAVLEKQFDDLRSTREVIFELQIKRADGEVRDSEVRMTRLTFDDSEYYQLNVRDVTDRRKQEKELISQKQMLDAVINCTADNIMLVDKDFIIRLANKTFRDFYGELGLDVKPGMSIFELVNPEQKEVYRARFQKALDGNTSTEEIFYTFRQVATYSEVSRFPVYDEEGNVFGFGIVSRDITTRKVQEAEINRKSKQMETAQLLAGMAGWEYSNVLSQISPGPNIENIFGLPLEEIEGNPNFWHAVVSEEDRLRITDLITALAEGAQPFDMEVEIKMVGQNTDSSKKWLKWAGVPEYDERNNHSGYICFVQDITREKEYDATLLRQTLTLNQIIDVVSQPIFWQDAGGKYAGYNTAFFESTGMQKDFQIIGKTDDEMPWRELAGRSRTEFEEVIRNGEPILNKIEPFRRNNEPERSIIMNKIPLKDETGSVIGVIGMFDFKE